jgi:hypothetical protein
MNEQLLAQIINDMRVNNPQGSVGNVTNNELARFVADPMNNTDAINAMRNANIAEGSVGNVSDTEMSMFSGSPVGGALAGIAGGVSNPMPRINEMRNNLATAGSVGNVSNREADFFNRLNELKKIGQRRILTDGEKQEAMFIQKMLPPVDLLPVDIDGASAGNALTKEQLDALLNRIYQMQGVR